eukprot:g25471.t1
MGSPSQARRLLQHGAGRAAAQKLLLRGASATSQAEQEDVVEGLNLVAFACGVASERASLQNLLREVASLLGPLRRQSVDPVHVPRISELVAALLSLEADESLAQEVAGLCKREGPGRLPLVPSLQAAQQAASAQFIGQKQRLRLAFELIDQVKAAPGMPDWPGPYALAQLLAGCALAGAAFRRPARKLTKASRGLEDVS